MHRIAHRFAQRLPRLAIPLAALMMASPLAASAQTVDGLYPAAGTATEVVTYGMGTAPSLAPTGLGPPSCSIAGHLTAYMVVAFRIGSVSYAGPLTFDSDFTDIKFPMFCGSYLSQIESFTNPTMSGSSPAGTLQCTITGGNFDVTLDGASTEAFLAFCDLNGSPLPELSFLLDTEWVPTAIDSSDHVTSAIAQGAVLVSPPA